MIITKDEKMNVFESIMKGLDEAVDWKAMVHTPLLAAENVITMIMKFKSCGLGYEPSPVY